MRVHVRGERGRETNGERFGKREAEGVAYTARASPCKLAKVQASTHYKETRPILCI